MMCSDLQMVALNGIIYSSALPRDQFFIGSQNKPAHNITQWLHVVVYMGTMPNSGFLTVHVILGKLNPY